MTMRNFVSLHITLLMVSIFIAGVPDVFSQQVIKFQPVLTQGRNTSVYHQHFSNYTLGSLQKAQVASLLQSQSHFDSLVIDVNGQSYSISLDANDVRADNYVLRVHNGSTIEQ